MSSVNIYQGSPAQPVEVVLKSQKQSKISYTRDFLFSLSELDVCKKLPTGFDPSILSEFEETSHSIPEWQRNPGSLSLQSFRRGEYGSSPPSRGDSGNYSRGSHGRWDSHSSGSIDKDSDSYSDCSDSGKRYGNQARRSWQNSEHDGLLGSGAFLRPPGYAAGASAPKVRGNGHYQLTRSNEPYQPPRPYKAVPHSRRDATDLYNEETFGSTECSSQDRAEEERKRRASFELMRKEQQKTFQEKQKQVSGKQKEIFDTDVTALLEGSEDEKKLPNKDNVSQTSVLPLVSENDSARLSFPTQTPASRPLVPPGFMSSILEKNLGSKTPIPPPAAEVVNVGFGDSIKHAEDNLVANGTYNNHDEKQSWCMDSTEQHYEAKSAPAPLLDDSERIVSASSSAEVSGNSAAVDSLCESSNLSEACEGQSYGEVTTIDNDKVTGHKILNTTGQDHSTSILEKLFGSALTANTVGSSSFIEHHDHDIKADDSWSSKPFQSSKFAQWFLDEEKKPVNDLSCSKPRDLLSLIVTSDRGGSQVSGVSDEKAMEHVPPIFPLEGNELANMFIASTATSASVGISEPVYPHNKSGTTQGVLTCEYLEQSILQELNEKSSILPHSVQPWSVTDSKADVDNGASQHLLSLLQKGTSMKDPALLSNLDVSPDKPHVFGVGSFGPVVHGSSEENTENIQNSEKTLTLETLFGTAFMEELQSVGAPVSIQRGSTGGGRRTDVSEPNGLPFPVSDDGLISSTVGEFGLSNSSTEGNYLASKVKSEKIEGHWLGFGDPQIDLGSKFGAAGGFQDRADGTMEIKLPEEDSLIAVADSVNTQNATFMPAFNATKDNLLSPSNTPVDIAEKLAALNATLKDERSKVPGLEGPPFRRGPYDLVDPEMLYHNLPGQPSSPHVHHSTLNHGRPFLHSLEAHHAHMNSPIKYVGPENIIHHDPPPHHHFSANMFRHPPFQHVSAAPPRFDQPHHSMLPQMHMPNSFPPHLIQGLPRGSPLPPHAFNQMAGYMPEMNPMQGFPVNHRQPNYNGLGFPMPETNHPEALERLFEMELRANSKQMRPVASPGHSMGMYGHELDMGFRYR
ncbi:uncharacterized protein LOC122665149 isoform X2 [Telopea speciosissima]|uniref:uncharacterized protein LOC122665149 isoform X2 n=1 Tax=Telopea speciosissima TaxID=54955 RepID=UPI001CC4F9CE|nr:uncharacterized protein LOC122665149 isoform X2 [Telopea speciosissima]